MADYILSDLQNTVPEPAINDLRTQLVHDGTSRKDSHLNILRCWTTSYEEGECCPICLEKYIDDGTIHDKGVDCSSLEPNHGIPESPVQTPCRHKFGIICLARWLSSAGTCPLCRKRLIHPKRDRDDDVRQIRRFYSTESLVSFPPFLNPLQASLEYGADINLQHMILRRSSSLRQSLSNGSGMASSTFQQQQWDARMGGLGFINPYNNDPRNTTLGHDDPGTIRISLPPATTTHGHPTIASIAPNTAAFTERWIRRYYDVPNITSYEMRPLDNNTRYPDSTRRSEDQPPSEEWINWDHFSGSSRRRRSIRDGTRRSLEATNVLQESNAVVAFAGAPNEARRTQPGNMNVSASRTQSSNGSSLATAIENIVGEGTMAGMSAGERTISPSDGDTGSIGTGSGTEYSLVRALAQTMGVGTVFGMPRAEWRDSESSQGAEASTNSSTETQVNRLCRASRVSEVSTIEEDLANLPGLGSSMWARKSRSEL